MIPSLALAFDLLEMSSRMPSLAIVLAFLVPLAIAVYYLGNRRYHRDLSRTLSGGSRWGKAVDLPVDPAFAAQVRRFDERAPAPIAEAPEGLCKLVGTLCGADVTLGGRPGFECVWRNRADGRRDMAVAAEVVFLRDDTAQASIEGLERAQVIAPIEKGARNIEWQGLYLGDEVEVIGRLVRDPDPEAAPVGDDPKSRIVGTLGGDGKLHVRLRRRPPWPAPAAEAPAAEAPAAPPTPQGSPEGGDATTKAAIDGPTAAPDLIPSNPPSDPPASTQE